MRLAVGGRAAADGAQAVAVLGQREQLGAVLLGVEPLPGRNRPDQPAAVVFVLGNLGRLPAVESRRWDAVPVGELYPGSELSVSCDAASEKGTSISPRFSAQAAQATSSNCRLVSDSMSRSHA